MTLITPNLAVGDIDRIRDQDGNWRFGHLTASSDVPVERFFSTAYEIGFGLEPLEVGAAPRRYAVMVYEQRLSGVRPYCPHPAIDEDPSGAVRARYFDQPDPLRLTEQLPSAYPTADPYFGSGSAPCRDAMGGVADATECAALGHSFCVWYSATNECLAQCRGLSEADCSVPAGCVWAPTDDGNRCIHQNKDAGGPHFDTFQQYLDQCAEPLATNDARIGSHVFFLLSERVDEAQITPIPFGLQFPNGSTDPSSILGLLGDVVGYGEGIDVGDGMRRVAVSGTALSAISPTDSLYDWATSVHLANTADVAVSAYFAGDGPGNGGAGHLDWAAPLLLEAGGRRRVFAFNLTGINPAYDEHYSVPLSDQSAPVLRAFLDPDGDGVHRGFIDARLSDGSPNPAYIDADRDGLSEYRVQSGTPGTGGCIAYDPGGGQCWIATGNDNCGPPLPGERRIYSYSNADQRDRDGDGIGDECDVCPVAWDQDQQSCPAARDLPATISPSGRMIRRGNPVGLLCATRINATDADGDGFLDAYCDNCLGVPNDQQDWDGDGVGDACELPGCGDDFNPGLTDPTDGDSDGVVDACDNCPPSRCANPVACANALQEDPDFDGWGEVCDNCPASVCATPAMCSNNDQLNCNADTEVARGVVPRGDLCDATPCPRFALGNVPTPSAIGPTYRASTAGFTGEPFAHASTAGTLRTGFRFCSCDTTEDSVDEREDCALSGEGSPDCGLDNFSRYDDPTETKWRVPTTLSFPYEVDVDPGPGSEAVLRYTPPGPDARRFNTRWEFMTNIAAWGVPFESIGGLIERARGVVWGHGVAYEPRTVPSEGGPVTDAFGCPALASCGTADRNFTSHHWSGELERLDGLHLPWLESVPLIVPLIVSVLPQEICPVCRHVFPIPQFAWCPDDLCVRWPAMPDLEVPVTDMEMLQVLTGRVDANLLQQLAFATNMRWVPASEPRERLDSPATYFVGITQNTEVTLAAQLDAGLLVGAPVNATFAQTPTAGSTLLLSGGDHVLYQLAPGNELEWMHLPSQERASVELSQSLGQVQTATLLLDEPGARALAVDTLGGVQRILRIDLRSGQVEVLASYATSNRDRHELSTLPDGRVVVVGWKEGVATFAAFIVDVTPAGALLEVRAYDGTGGMLGSVRGSAEGISFLLADAELAWRPDGVPFEAMAWVDAAGQLAQAF